jgi:hypothetical protein
MRKTELWFGVCGGALGVAIAALTYFEALPYAQQPDKLYSVICAAAGVTGIAGALLVPKRNVAGSVIMAVALIAVTYFGFPWQSVSAVLLIISATLSLAPVREPQH